MPTQISLKSKDKQIPLKKVNVEIDVVGLITQFTINQTYYNDEDRPLEVTYTFPTPSGATIYDFKALIDEKVIKCVIKDKDQARKEYSEAISSGDGAYMMEKVTGDVFNCSVGNIPGKKEVTLTIRYAMQLQSEIDAKRLRLNFPLTIMPRYEGSNSSSLFPKTVQSGPSVNNPKVDYLPYEFSMSGTVYMPEGLEDVKCKTHTFTNCIVTENACTFNIEKFESIECDLIINVSRNKPSTIGIQQKTDMSLTDEMYRYCTMINIVPDFDETETVNPKDLHYSFILDRSGSMQGQNLENCKEAASIFVSMLPVGATFDIYHFGDDYKKFMYEGQDERKQRAVEWIRNIEIDGGTELFNVLSDAFKSSGNKKGIIVLLSDGGISNTESVMQLCASHKNVRVFTIGIGDSVSQDLIQGLADIGCGKAEFVESEDKNAIRTKVISQLQKSQSKMSAKNVLKIECDSEYVMTPDSIRTIYNGDNNIAYVFSKTPVKSVTYEQDGTHLKCEIMNEVSSNDGCPIHRVAGNDLIKTIASRKTKTSQLYYVPQPSSDKKEKIIEVSKNLNILSEYTGFIGVEYRIGADKTLDESSFKEVPLQVPKNNYSNFFESTASYSSRGLSGAMCYNNMVPCFSSVQPQSTLNSPYILTGHHQGINTIGQSLKNANHNIRSSPANPNITVSPWLHSTYGPDLMRRQMDLSFDVDELECSSSNSYFGGDRFVSSVVQSRQIDRGPVSQEGFVESKIQSKRYMNTREDKMCEDSEEMEMGFDLFGGYSQSNIETNKYDVKLTINKLTDCHFINKTLLTSKVNCSLSMFTNGIDVDVDEYVSITDVNFTGIYRVISLGSSMIPWVLERVTF